VAQAVPDQLRAAFLAGASRAATEGDCNANPGDQKVVCRSPGGAPPDLRGYKRP
jgi:hypothetical protein